ncbi:MULTISPECIES: alkane 1-monooxygenase [Mycolicibacterium]|uniref:Alkane 1-monooxygenase n=1 Tax=Mycolicibacterium vanbaalenii (strain DSM 7251 / JCM 13017 / BCRC 16820 / KCTC 9966 / NRRL B-24157 / PYR-1) TaxID=350058 RepID=A1T9Q2_MYCVP|nr:alkane 1-monooxygenase [Mycolicibacterium vanbaalenii]ABM13902.1 alkane 1-monooxygenase [Mycolicibacterium vanbaalenii PYR-1]MCV7129061.1 alkane 1-monooxygenase [Mycolicibacterium vanbaalenii PYR-1]
MPIQQRSPQRHSRAPVVAQAWRDQKRYGWLLGLVIPTLVPMSWAAAALTGAGVFWWSGPALMFLVIPTLDYLVGPDADNPPDSALTWLENDRFYRWATYLYLPAQYVSLMLACWLWSGGGGVAMSDVDKVGLMLTIGGIGGVAINIAHELGHQRARSERRLSKIALAQTGYGHFFVEHNRGHHARVATPEDPASSRLGESIYTFQFRSVLGSLRSAWRLERRRLSRHGKSPWTLRNDVLNSWLMTAALFAVLVAGFGVEVLPWLLGQAVVGICLLESINYLEHYGLRRQRRADGTYEQVRPSHSWNSNSVISNVFLFHLQRHSDHHANPHRRYQALCHADEAPQLPSGYATMVLLALFPPLWRRVMDGRVLAHYGGDIRLAALSPRKERRLLRRYG